MKHMIIRFVTVVAIVIAATSPLTLSAQRTPFRVCADPDYLPFSNKAGQGFENKIAVMVARALGQPLEYVWADSRSRGGFGEFLGRTLDANKCDAVMSLPYGNREELTTQPY